MIPYFSTLSMLYQCFIQPVVYKFSDRAFEIGRKKLAVFCTRETGHCHGSRIDALSTQGSNQRQQGDGSEN